MADTIDIVEDDEQTSTQKELSPIEKRAIEMGWNPDFDGPEEDFVDAKEYVNRRPLFDKIEAQSKQIKNVTKALDALRQHYGKVQETEFNRALSQLKAERKNALSQGDGDNFERLDDEIKKVETQIIEVKQAAQAPVVESEVVHPEFQSWVNKNPWYSSTRYMREFADDVGLKFAQSGMENKEVLRQVELAVRKEFPQKFTNPNKSDAPDVGSSRGASRSSKADDIELNEQEQRIMHTLVKSGAITKEKYIADLKKIKGLS